MDSSGFWIRPKLTQNGSKVDLATVSALLSPSNMHGQAGVWGCRKAVGPLRFVPLELTFWAQND